MGLVRNLLLFRVTAKFIRKTMKNKKGFTFGIITSRGTGSYLERCIKSIENLKIDPDRYEIIIVGDCGIESSDKIKIIPFDETKKNLWITKKKNIITLEACFENICFLHDYVSLEEGWYEGFLRFGNDWDICMNPISNLDGTRCIDWMGLPDDPVHGNVMLPYDYKGSEGMYIPGYYWVAKRDLMVDFSLNEDFVWNEGEDIEWSKRVLGGYPQRWLKNLADFENGIIKIKKHKYVLNTLSKVVFLKQKDVHPNFRNPYDLHSGKESRPLKSTKENYYYLNFNQDPSRLS